MTVEKRIDELCEIDWRKHYCNNQSRFFKKLAAYWDRGFWLEEQFDRAKLKQDIEFLDDEFIPYPHEHLKTVFVESQILIEEVPLV